MTFRLDGSAADEHDGSGGVVGLLLFESTAETVNTGIAVEKKRVGVVGDAVPVGLDEDRRRVQLDEKFPHDGFHGRSKDELGALFENGGDGPYPLGHIAQKFPVIGKASQEGAEAVSDLPTRAFSSALPLFGRSA